MSEKEKPKNSDDPMMSTLCPEDDLHEMKQAVIALMNDKEVCDAMMENNPELYDTIIGYILDTKISDVPELSVSGEPTSSSLSVFGPGDQPSVLNPEDQQLIQNVELALIKLMNDETFRNEIIKSDPDLHDRIITYMLGRAIATFPELQTSK